MKDINDLYNDYLLKKTELETSYNDKVKEIKDRVISECEFKKGMIIQFHKWIGRISSIGFNDVFDEHFLKINFIDSDTLANICITQSEFDKIKKLDEPSDLNMKLLSEGIARLEKEEESHKEAIEHINTLHSNRMIELEKDLSIIRKDCIHDWRYVQESMFECKICKDRRTIKG